MNRTLARTLLLTALTLSLFAPASLPAAEIFWGNTGTDYNAGASWAGTPPGASDVGVFNAAMVTQPNLTADITNQQLRFSVGGASGYILSANAGAELTLTYTGTGTSSTTGSALVSLHTSGINTITAPIVLGAAASSTQTFLATNGGTTIVSGNISELNAGVRLRVEGGSAGIMRLAGNNSFTGGLVLNTTNLEIASPNAIPTTGTITLQSGTIRSSDNTNYTFANPVDLSGTVNFGGTVAGQQGNLVFSGPGALSGNFTVGSVQGLNPTPVSAVAFTVAIGETGGSRTLTVQGATNGSGLGYLFLLGANTYTGQTTINSSGAAGPVVVNTLGNTGELSSSLGAPTGSNRTIRMVMGGVVQSSGSGALRYIGGTTSTDRALEFTLSGDLSSSPRVATIDASGYGAITWTSDMTIGVATTGGQARSLRFDGTSTDANTFAGDIPGAGPGAVNFTKNGTGTWVLSGANAFAGGITVNSGKLVLDYATNPTVVATTNTLSMGGGALEFQGNNGGATAQTLGNLTFAADTGLSTIRVNQNGGSGTAVTLGTVTTTLGRTAVLFDLNGSGGSSVTIGSTITSDTGTDGKVLIRTSAGAYDFAVNNGAANPLVARNASATIGATNGNAALDYAFTTTGSIGTGNTGVAIAAQSLRIAPVANNQTMTITNLNSGVGGSAAGLLVDGGGVVYDGGAHDFTIAAAGSTDMAALRTGNNANGFTLHHLGTGKLTLADRVYLGYGGTTPFSGNATPVTLSGAGLIDWQGGSNIINGGQLLVHGATVRISGATNPTTLDTTATGRGTANIVLNGSGIIEAVNNDITRNVGTAAGALQWKGDGGFSAFGGNRAVNLAGGAAQTWGATSFVPSNNALVLSSNYSDSRIDFQNGLFFGNQQRVVRVQNGSANVDARLSGVLTGNFGGGLIKTGAGTLELTNANTYAGDTWVQEGRLLVNNTSGSGTGTGQVTVFAGSTLGGTGTIGGDAVVFGTHAPGNSPGIQTIASDLAYDGGAAVIEWELNGNTVTNVANPNAVFDSINVGGNLGFLDLTTLDLSFVAGGSNVLWSDSFWATSHTGTNGWLLFDVTGATSSVSNLSVATANWLDSGSNLFNTLREGSTFSLFQSGNDVYLNYNFAAPVPEPSSCLLLGFGALGLLRHARRWRLSVA